MDGSTRGCGQLGDRLKRQGRPLFEGRMNRHDIAALQRYAMARLPDARALLRTRLNRTNVPVRWRDFWGATGLRSSSARSCACGAMLRAGVRWRTRAT